MKGQNVLITAGPTREHWDPVRYLTNNSSGRMGIELAREASARGAKVTLILGPVADSSVLSILGKRSAVRVVSVVSAWEMYEAVKKHLARTTIFIGAAAVVDYRPAVLSKSKIKRHTPTMTLRLHGNPDIIAMVGHHSKHRPKVVVGFALETDHVLEHAREKLLRKRMDWIVANRESNMGAANGSAMLLNRWGDRFPLAQQSKASLAKRLFSIISPLKGKIILNA